MLTENYASKGVALSLSEYNWLKEHDGYCVLSVKVKPGARCRDVRLHSAEFIEVFVKSQAHKNAANDEMTLFLAKKTGVPKRSVTIIKGKSSGKKIIRIDGVTSNEIYAAFDNFNEA